MVKKIKQLVLLLSLVFIITAGFVLLNQQNFSNDDPYSEIASVGTINLDTNPAYDDNVSLSFHLPNKADFVSILILNNKVLAFVPFQNKHNDLIVVKNNSPPISITA